MKKVALRVQAQVGCHCTRQSEILGHQEISELLLKLLPLLDFGWTE